jgi:fructokinase
VDLNPKSSTYGYVMETVKPGWSYFDFVGSLKRALGLPVGFDTDVNSAALGEHYWGAAQGVDTFLYLTVGTGIGGGGMVGGHLIHGLVHPEMGHVRVPHDPQTDPYPGNCLFHGDCLEGLACGPALEERWGQPAPMLAPEHPAWELEAHYLALGLQNYICTFSPQRIVLGGGVMEQTHLFPKVRHKVQDLLNGYLRSPDILERIDEYIVPPRLGNRAGVLGAIALAQQMIMVQ